MSKYLFADAGLIDTVCLPDVAGANTAQTAGGFVAPKDIVITSVYLVADSAITGQDTNTITVSLRNYGSSGTGTSDIASYTFTSGKNVGARVPLALSLSSTDVAQGEVLGEVLSLVGTGMTYPKHRLQIIYKYK